MTTADVTVPDAPAESSNRSPLLRIVDVGLHFGGVQAFANVSLDVLADEVVGLAGPNGAGKSSLLNCVSGIYQVASGSIWFDGARINGVPADRIAASGVGRTVQHAEAFETVGAREVMMLGLHAQLPKGVLRYCTGLGSIRRAEAKGRSMVADVADLLGVQSFVRDNTRVDQLPYGVRKLVDIGRAIVSRPKLLLYDEPAAGLSAEEKQQLLSVIKRIGAEHKIAQIVVDHDIDFLSAVCHRIVVLAAGRIIADDDPVAIWRHQGVIESYLGEA